MIVRDGLFREQPRNRVFAGFIWESKEGFIQKQNLGKIRTFKFRKIGIKMSCFKSVTRQKAIEMNNIQLLYVILSQTLSLFV